MAHISIFIKNKAIDVRPISTDVPGVVFQQADLMSEESVSAECCDSLSCLHALGHFGLGRYGDSINPKGYELGIANMAKMLKPNGTLDMSTPIGKERVEFNANWVFDPRSIVSHAEKVGLQIDQLKIICSESEPEDSLIDFDSMAHLADLLYKLGLFVFRKRSE